MSSRLAAWSSRLLTFMGRVLVVKHVLQAIPIYHAMFLHAPDTICKKFSRLCKDFLWGFNKAGGRKLPLVAWEKMALPKIHGGLGFKEVKAHSKALLCRWILHALDNPRSEWAQLFAANLRLVRWVNQKKIKKYCYQSSDLILLGRPTGFGKLPYTGSLWKSWSALREHLILQDGAWLLGRWLIEDVVKVLPGLQNLPLADSRMLADLLGRMGAKIVQHLWNACDQHWHCFHAQLQHIRGMDNRIRTLALQFFGILADMNLQEIGNQTSAPSWQWLDSGTPLQHFLLSNGRRYQLLLPICSDMDRLNRIWHCSLTPEEWQGWWDALWTADLSTRSKVFIWRLVSQGFYTLKKAAAIGRDSPLCLHCRVMVEDLPHIFESCSFACTAWRSAFPWLQVGNRRGTLALITELGVLLPKHSGHTARLTLLVQVLYALWRARMLQVQESTPRSWFMASPLRSAEDGLRAIDLTLPPGQKYVRIIQAKQLLTQWWTDFHLAHRIPPTLSTPLLILSILR
ncbi:unnamed protein product [Calypogeia fissa]